MASRSAGGRVDESAKGTATVCAADKAARTSRRPRHGALHVPHENNQGWVFRQHPTIRAECDIRGFRGYARSAAITPATLACQGAPCPDRQQRRARAGGGARRGRRLRTRRASWSSSRRRPSASRAASCLAPPPPSASWYWSNLSKWSKWSGSERSDWSPRIGQIDLGRNGQICVGCCVARGCAGVAG